MRIADLTTPSANLREAYEQLEIAWRNLHELWNDPTSQAFEDQYIAPVRPRVKATLDAAARLSTVLDDAQRKCEVRKQS